jgi:hypothetical protein
MKEKDMLYNLFNSDLIQFKDGHYELINDQGFMVEATPEEVKIHTNPEPPVDPWFKSWFGN